MHFCQLEVRDDPCRMLGRCVKRKWEPKVDFTVASYLEFVMVACRQEPADCWDGGSIGSLGVLALKSHCR